MLSTFALQASALCLFCTLAAALGLPDVLKGLSEVNDRDEDVQKRQANVTIDAYTTVYLTDTATDTFTDILTDSMTDTATTAITTTMVVIPSLSGAADSGLILTPPPTLTFTGAADSGVPFVPPNATTSLSGVAYSSGLIALPPSSLVTAAPSSAPTNQICVLDPLLTDFLSVSADASSFCSSFISIPMYTTTSNIATSVAFVQTLVLLYTTG